MNERDEPRPVRHPAFDRSNDSTSFTHASTPGRAVFLDRDGTLVHPRHYPSHPDDLVLYEGIGAPLRALASAGFALVVITNQAGLARGKFTEEQLYALHEHLTRVLAAEGVFLDAIYHCPHHPAGVVSHLAVTCACRKPAPGMLQQAAADLNLDLSRSWFLGDILDDVEAGNRAGCRTVLVDIGSESLPASEVRTPTYVGRGTNHALRVVRAIEGIGDSVALDYSPPSWQVPVGGPYARGG